MSDPASKSPDQISATNDPGDETARRFRYQWSYAAIACCILLDRTLDVVEIFCEQHEDVLLKHADGTFSGLQIKTRRLIRSYGNHRRRSNKGCCFASLEEKFPTRFRKFAFLTNHPLYSAKNGSDVCYVLAKISQATDLHNVSAKEKKFIQKVAQIEECSEETVFATLKKTDFNHDLPKLQDIQVRLIQRLLWSGQVLTSAANRRLLVRLALTEECGRASSLAHLESLPAYVSIGVNPKATQLDKR
ncbi:MAG: DUF4297 domain-containing protein [bacterium]|nr:DUF4297 domain-containing protein [bacterium]